VKRTILIVDDEPAIADTLDYALRTEGFNTHCVGLGRQALDAVRQGDIAVVILDVGLPDMNGFDVCREIRRESDVPVIFLTARSDEVDRIVGLELGADDYVPKPFSPPAPPAGEPTPRFRVDAEGARIAYDGVWLALTRYEYRLLATLLERPRRVFSRARLMELVWSDAQESLDRTVDAHIKTLRGKLRAVRVDDPIETHRGLGYSIRNDAS
jgi:two-component system catabolic regulation response regulator CreB